MDSIVIQFEVIPLIIKMRQSEKKSFFVCGLQKILRDRPFALRKVGQIRWIQLFLIILPPTRKKSRISL
jgi:hypothetical protein